MYHPYHIKAEKRRKSNDSGNAIDLEKKQSLKNIVFLFLLLFPNFFSSLPLRLFRFNSFSSLSLSLSLALFLICTDRSHSFRLVLSTFVQLLNLLLPYCLLDYSKLSVSIRYAMCVYVCVFLLSASLPACPLWRLPQANRVSIARPHTYKWSMQRFVFIAWPRIYQTTVQ